MAAGSKNAASRRISLRGLLQDITIQECHDLRSGTGIIRAERGIARAVCNTVFDRPKNRISEVCARLHISKWVIDAGRCRFSFVTPKERDDLRTGAGVVRAEGRAGRAVRNALFHRPEDGIVVVRARLHVRERVRAACGGGLPGCAPEEGHDLRARAALLGAERACTRAVGDLIRDCPVDWVMRPVALRRHIGKGLAGAGGTVARYVTSGRGNYFCPCGTAARTGISFLAGIFIRRLNCDYAIIPSVPQCINIGVCIAVTAEAHMQRVALLGACRSRNRIGISMCMGNVRTSEMHSISIK